MKKIVFFLLCVLLLAMMASTVLAGAGWDPMEKCKIVREREHKSIRKLI